MSRTLRILPWLLLAMSGIAVLAQVAAYWGATAEALNRSVIVAASIWLLSRSTARGSSDATQWTTLLGFAFLALAAATSPVGWFLAAQVGPRPVLLWWLAASWLTAAMGAVLIIRGSVGLQSVAFALFFFLFTLPLPHRIELPLQSDLQQATTTLSAALLSIGFNVERSGFVLRLPSGDLGVLEACSGIRSVTALSAIAALIANWRGMGILRGAIFVALSLPVVIFANVFRVAASGVLQERVGVNAIQGAPHEILGFSSFLLGLAALAGLAWLFRFSSSNSEVVATNPAASATRFSVGLACGMIGLLLLTSIAAACVGWRSVERLHHSAPLEEVATAVGDWRGEEIPVPDDVRDVLTCDRVSHRVYRDRIGQELHAWVIFWSGAGSVRGYHHPDVCWPNRGWTAIDRRVREIELGTAGSIPATIRLFENGGRRQMLCYWTQEGGRIWTEADEEAARLEGTPGHRWIRERLLGGPVKQSGRISVLIGCDLWGPGDFAETVMIAFCRQFAAEIYRVMPWAVPAHN